MEEALRRQYLAAMGIETWVPRHPAGGREAVDTASEQPRPVAADVPTGPSPKTGGLSKPRHPGESREPEQTTRDWIPASAGMTNENVSGLALNTESGPPDWLEEVPPPTEEWASCEMPELLPAAVTSVAALDWTALAYRVTQCQACELHGSRQQTVFGVGDRSADLMVIGEAPGAEEDRQGEPFVGRAGQLLNAMLLAIGLRRDQVYIANILKCRPPGNRDPRPEEALKCEPFLLRQVAQVRPRVILAVGKIAAQNLLKSQETVGRMREKAFQFEGVPVVVSYHPAYLLRSPEQKAKAWQDLQRAAMLLRA